MPVELVDTVSASQAACKLILEAAAHGELRVALDLEGRDLGPAGKIGIVTLAVSAAQVYLFDFADAGVARGLLDDGLLKDVLEHPSVVKLMFDCRMDVGALFHQYQVTITNVLDLQVPSVRRYSGAGPYLIGMQKVFGMKLGLFSMADERVKSGGRKLFAPELGGSYDVWFKRPITNELIQYCAVDVKHFFAAATTLLNGESQLVDCRKVSLKRVTACVTGRVDTKSSERDF